jgi:uroporphyrinogen-III synthase
VKETPLVAVTRAEEGIGSLAQALAVRGCDVFALPTVCFAPPEDFSPLDEALGRADDFDWLVVTSPHAVDVLASRPGWPALRTRTTPAVAAVGPRTAVRLAGAGRRAHLVAEDPGAEGLVRVLQQSREREDGSLHRLRFLWPRSDRARRDLPDALLACGAMVTEVVAYRTRPAEPATAGAFLRFLERGEIDAVTFMSPSSAEGLARALGRTDLSVVSRHALVASVGPTTSEALRELGAPPATEARTRTAAGLAEAVVMALRNGGGGRP